MVLAALSRGLPRSGLDRKVFLGLLAIKPRKGGIIDRVALSLATGTPITASDGDQERSALEGSVARLVGRGRFESRRYGNATILVPPAAGRADIDRLEAFRVVAPAVLALLPELGGVRVGLLILLAAHGAAGASREDLFNALGQRVPYEHLNWLANRGFVDIDDGFFNLSRSDAFARLRFATFDADLRPLFASAASPTLLDEFLHRRRIHRPALGLEGGTS